MYKFFSGLAFLALGLGSYEICPPFGVGMCIFGTFLMAVDVAEVARNGNRSNKGGR